MPARSLAQWLALKPATRTRYTNALTRAGVDPLNYYLAGDNLQVARGHSFTPEHPGRKTPTPPLAAPWIRLAESKDIQHWIPDWDSLTRQRKNELARWYYEGHFMPYAGRVLTSRERAQRHLAAADDRVLRRPTRQQSADMVNWQITMYEYTGRTWSDTKNSPEWAAYRDIYYKHFNAA